MSEPLDIFADHIGLNINRFGAIIGIFHTSPESSALQCVATIRMSLELHKVAAFLMARQVSQYESQTQCAVPMDEGTLEKIHIPRTEWEQFWSYRFAAPTSDAPSVGQYL